jgi:glycosyltransferase involved in cell wall biosynthesis
MHQGASIVRISVFIKSYPPGDGRPRNGFEKAVRGLAHGMAVAGHPITILTEGPEDAVLTSERGYTIRWFANASAHPYVTLAPGLAAYIRERLHAETDLVLLNGLFNPGVYLVARQLIRNHIPYIFAPHSIYNAAMMLKNPHLKLPYWLLAERAILAKALGVHIESDLEQQWLRRLGIRTPVITTENGYEADEVPPEETLRWSDSGPPRLLFFGRLAQWIKGLDILTRAFAEARGSCEMKLVLQGPDEGAAPKVTALAKRLGISDDVTLRAPDNTQPGAFVIAGHDIFCLTSRVEGFSMALIEALLAGRVLLISERVAQAPYVRANGCGVVVKPTVFDVRDGLLELLSRRAEWREMGMAGRRFALEYLPWPAVAERLVRQYQALLSGIPLSE